MTWLAVASAAFVGTLAAITIGLIIWNGIQNENNPCRDMEK